MGGIHLMMTSVPNSDTTCTIRIIFAGQNFAKRSYLCITEKFMEKGFHQYSEGCHILYAIFNTGQKISVINFLPMRASGKTGEDLLLVKFLHILYCVMTWCLILMAS